MPANSKPALPPALSGDWADISRAVVALHEAERALSDTRRPGEESADANMDWLAESGAFRGLGVAQALLAAIELSSDIRN